MAWLIVAALMMCLFLIILYSALVVASDADDAMEIRAERIMTDVTPVPEPVETWVRYDVNLEDDLQKYIEQLCKEYEVPAPVVMAVIEVESNCDPELVGDNGNSWGLMQIYSTQHTARCVRLGAWNLLDPYMNVRVGIDYLSELLNCGHGIEWALSWYNGHGGEPCEYAYTVMVRSETLLESAQLMEE